MIAFGGIIGAGIFVGSGQIIASTGPAAILAYLIAGLLGIAVMRMLTVLSVDEPTTGSFARYVTRAFGWIPGFTIGWLYWWLMAVTVGVECSGAGGIAHIWLPGVAPWVLSVALMVIFAGANLAPVRVFAETQFWLSAIKVVVLAVVLIAGLLAIFGLLPGTNSPGTANLVDLGGFLPKGGTSVLAAILVAVFSYTGLEMVSIAAGEARTPRKTVRASMATVLPTTTILYVGTVLIVVTMVAWNGSATGSSPFAALLSALGVARAGQIVDVLVFLALVTVLNSSLWAASRMAFFLAGQGDAPKGMRKLSESAVPTRAVILTAVLGLITVAIQAAAPTGVFLVLVDSSGAVGLLVWLFIAVAYLKLRGMDGSLGAQRPLIAVLAWLVIVVIGLMLIGMAILPDTRSQILATLSLGVIIAVIALWRDTV
ncbi:MAG TPA: amino acid permease [Pseudonocardiaceae bacterium]|jgi:GABA permease|nr:amino acid permease [Pseudonocardiaceae bacterium]